jgi:hypothetical protein
MRTSVAAISHPHDTVTVGLRTDSPHLAEFFRANWARAPDDAHPEATVTALRADAQYYGLPPSLNGVRWYSEAHKHIFYLGHESYANLKITVRGLCSHLDTEDILWVHGCVMKVDLGQAATGVLIIGRSGGGKTTLTAAVRRVLGDNVRIVNDDWGAVSLRTLCAASTDESLLHMKYMSVATLRPDLQTSPIGYPSEHFNGNRCDPVARLLISPVDVFGASGLCRSTKLDLVVLLRRTGETLPGITEANSDVVDIIANGEYSDYYQAVERFFNGSLFLLSAVDDKRQRALVSHLIQRVPTVVLGNVEVPELVARRLIEHIERLEPSLPTARHAPSPAIRARSISSEEISGHRSV